MNKEIEVSDETLKIYVNDIFAKQYRQSSYNTLLKAKKWKDAKKTYYNIINAYHQYEKENLSSGNACCIIPETTLLKVCCSPTIPTYNAADPANSSIILTPKFSKITVMAINT